MVQCRIADEANISNKHCFCLAIIELIYHAGLTKTVFEVEPLYPWLIRELIVNLQVEFDDPNSPKYSKVHVCDLCFNMSLTIIDDYLGVALSHDYL